MTVEVGLIIAVLSFGISFVFSIASWKRNHSADAKQDASSQTAVIVGIDNIKTSLAELKSEFKTESRGTKQDLIELRERLTVAEQSIKALWHQEDNKHKDK